MNDAIVIQRLAHRIGKESRLEAEVLFRAANRLMKTSQCLQDNVRAGNG